MYKDPLTHIRGVSSGTLSRLVGSRVYSDIQTAENRWFQWIWDRFEKYGEIYVYQDWRAAWNAFVAANPEWGYYQTDEVSL